MNENNGMTVVQALNQIQSWLNAGEYEKVIQGCQEILELEPGNQRALSLLKQAEERRFAASQMEQKPEVDPLKSLEVEGSPQEDRLEEKAEEPTPTQAPAQEEEEPYYYQNEHSPSEKRKLFMAMAVPALLVVIIGGGIIWHLNRQQIEDSIDEAITPEESDLSYLEANEERIETLSAMGDVLDQYKAVQGAYPSISQVESVLVNSGEFDGLPTDPRHGEFDKKGKVFGYMYALYDGPEGENSIYVLSAIFEDSKGFAYAWTVGADSEDHEDYREYKQDNVLLLGEEASSSTSSDEKPKVKVSPESSEDEN